MKIIFLDFDGVLNSSRYFKKISKTNFDHQKMIDPEAIERLNKIIAATEAEVVISSSWRLVHKMSDLRGFLAKRGFRGLAIDRTPHLPGKIRGDEVQDWLYHHPSVTHFVIFDDCEDMGYLSENLIRTDWDTGLLDMHVEKALKILQR